MILVDTSVWVDHLRSGNDQLAGVLNAGRVSTHPFVVGELACGNLRNRHEVLALLDALPTAPVARETEVRLFLEAQQLMGRGIGYIDVHLLASATLAGGDGLWTRDRRLAAVAAGLQILFEPGR